MLLRLILPFGLLFESISALEGEWIFAGFETFDLKDKINQLKAKVDNQEYGSSVSVEAFIQNYVDETKLLVNEKNNLMPYAVVQLKDFQSGEVDKIKSDIKYLNTQLTQSVVQITDMVEEKLSFVEQSVNVVGLVRELHSIRTQSNQQVLTEKNNYALD